MEKEKRKEERIKKKEEKLQLKEQKAKEREEKKQARIANKDQKNKKIRTGKRNIRLFILPFAKIMQIEFYFFSDILLILIANISQPVVQQYVAWTINRNDEGSNRGYGKS